MAVAPFISLSPSSNSLVCASTLVLLPSTGPSSYDSPGELPEPWCSNEGRVAIVDYMLWLEARVGTISRWSGKKVCTAQRGHGRKPTRSSLSSVSRRDLTEASITPHATLARRKWLAWPQPGTASPRMQHRDCMAALCRVHPPKIALSLEIALDAVQTRARLRS